MVSSLIPDGPEIVMLFATLPSIPVIIIFAWFRSMSLLEHGTFTFQVPMSSLKGPNCPLMSVLLRAIKAEGKQEQYATFTGSILDKAELMTDGEQTVRIKGKMSINGVEQYTVMKVHLVSHNGELILGTELPVSFDDYNIRLPLVPGRGRIDEVVVEISATLVSAPDLSMK